MLSQLHIKNFKAWKDTGKLRLAPLTVLFGANSAGKSSLGHLLLALKQTAAAADRRRALHVGDETSLVDLGSFIDSLHGRDREAELEFTLDWHLQTPLTVDNPFELAQRHEGTHLRLTSKLGVSPQDQPFVRELGYKLGDAVATALGVTYTRSASGEMSLDSQPYLLVPAPGRAWPLEPPEKFYRVSERSLARYQNADFLATFAVEIERNLSGLYHLGPLRVHPRRAYTWAGNTPDDVGSKGENAIACLLSAQSDGRKLARGPAEEARPFAEFIAHWLMDLGVIESFEVQQIAPGRRDYEVRVKTLGGLTEVALPDVGFGVSQVLPALVQVFYCPEGSIVWIEQPEIHLHPGVQAELADVFISAVRSLENGKPRNVQLIIETHSEHFLNRLQRRIAEQLMAPEEVAIYFARAGTEGAALERLLVNEYGDITNWPDNFFGDEMGDIVGRTEAAARRRTTGVPQR